MNFNDKLSRLRKRATQKKLGFDLDDEWLTKKAARGVCEITGIPFDYNELAFVPSVDRIDSTKGYTKDNCMLILWLLNIAKGPEDYNLLYEWAVEFVEKFEKEHFNEDLLGVSR